MTPSFPTRRSSDLRLIIFIGKTPQCVGSGEMTVRAGLAHRERNQKGDRADRRNIPAKEALMPPLLQQQRDIFGGAAKDRRGDRMAEPDAERAQARKSSCRARVCQYVSISGVAGSVKNTKNETTT